MTNFLKDSIKKMYATGYPKDSGLKEALELGTELTKNIDDAIIKVELRFLLADYVELLRDFNEAIEVLKEIDDQGLVKISEERELWAKVKTQLNRLKIKYDCKK